MASVGFRFAAFASDKMPNKASHNVAAPTPVSKNYQVIFSPEYKNLSIIKKPQLISAPTMPPENAQKNQFC